MKTVPRLVTPQWAAALLQRTQELVAAGKMNQRPISPETVEQYTRAILADKWVFTHQGMAINELGGIADGQQRAAAIVRADRSVRMLVTTNMPLVAMRNGYSIATIDAVDRGRVRPVGQQLQISHAMKNGSNVAAICKALSVACSNRSNLKLSVTDVLEVLHIYGAEIDCVRDMHPSWKDNAVISAGLVLGLATGEPGRIFAQQYLLGEHKRNDPANILKQWCRNVHFKQGGSVVRNLIGCVAFCLQAQVAGHQLSRGFSSDKALLWLIDQQGRKAARVRALFSAPAVAATV
jgi:hypothetical protein